MPRLRAWQEWKRPLLWLRVLEAAGVMYVLMRLAGAGYRFFSLRNLLSLAGLEPLRPLVFLILFGVALIAAVQVRREIPGVMRATAPVWLLVIWAVLSALGSAHPPSAFQDALVLLGATAFGMYLSIRFRIEHQLLLLGAVIGIIAAESAGMILLDPSAGISRSVVRGGGRGYFLSPDVWNGIFLNSNFLGKVLAQGTLAFLFLAFRKGKALRFSLPLLLCGILLAGSQSRTSLAALLLSLLGLVFLRFLARRRQDPRLRYSLLALALGAGCIGWISWKMEWALEILGTDSTLNGRTSIWAALWQPARSHLLFGFGYRNFWLGADGGVSGGVAASLGWYPDHAHNGFLDLWLELGLVGLILLGVSLAAGLIRGFRKILRSGFGSPTELWPLAYLFFALSYNLGETDLLGPPTLIWPLTAAALARLSMNRKAPGSPEAEAAPRKGEASAEVNESPRSGERRKPSSIGS